MLESPDEVWHGTVLAYFLLASSTAVFSKAGTYPVQNSSVHRMKGAVSNQRTVVAGVNERDHVWRQPRELRPSSWGIGSPAAQPAACGFQATE